MLERTIYTHDAARSNDEPGHVTIYGYGSLAALGQALGDTGGHAPSRPAPVDLTDMVPVDEVADSVAGSQGGRRSGHETGSAQPSVVVARAPSLARDLCCRPQLAPCG